MDFLSFLPVLHLKVQIILTVKHIYTGFNSEILVDTDCDAELMWWSSATPIQVVALVWVCQLCKAAHHTLLPTSGFPHRHQP